jgi:hypothetical protein
MRRRTRRYPFGPPRTWVETIPEEQKLFEDRIKPMAIECTHVKKEVIFECQIRMTGADASAALSGLGKARGGGVNQYSDREVSALQGLYDMIRKLSNVSG